MTNGDRLAFEGCSSVCFVGTGQRDHSATTLFKILAADYLVSSTTVLRDVVMLEPHSLLTPVLKFDDGTEAELTTPEKEELLPSGWTHRNWTIGSAYVNRKIVCISYRCGGMKSWLGRFAL